MENEKVKALADFLQVSKKEAEQLIKSEDYLVLTDAEAEQKASDEIVASLWAFNADFILEHNEKMHNVCDYEWKAAKESLENAQKNQCESLNGLVLALIDDIDEFCEDAINADGRGHFISFYDGKENEQNGFFIYRMY